MRTFLTANWRNIVMANYEIDPQILLPYLPKGVELDYFEGKTYVSLVGFMFKDTAIFGIPIPVMGSFEEVNLRFYVVRKESNKTKRGVVFINETVPNKIVAWVANKLYKEHYTAIPTKHFWQINQESKFITYKWKVKNSWNDMKIIADVAKSAMKKNSMEEFIFEHYYGYTKVSDNESIEYKINHPSWEVNRIFEHEINCDFAMFYGNNFNILNQTKPQSVFIAEGSAISVDWKRVRF